jgi:chemotaxis signal transduction protein
MSVRSIRAMRILKESIRARKARKTQSGKTQVLVIEEDGELTAIIVDKMRGVVRIPLGTVDPPLSYTQ